MEQNNSKTPREKNQDLPSNFKKKCTFSYVLKCSRKMVGVYITFDYWYVDKEEDLKFRFK